MGDDGQHGISQSADVMIHDMQKKALEVGDIARLMKGKNLATSVSDNF